MTTCIPRVDELSTGPSGRGVTPTPKIRVENFQSLEFIALLISL